MLRPISLLLAVSSTASLHVKLDRRTALVAGTAGLLTQPHRRVASAAVSLPTPSISLPSPICDQSVTQVRSARGQDITLVGTAHISEDSAELVSRIIRNQRPDVVMIELDPARAAKLIGRASQTLKLEDPERAQLRGARPDLALAPLPPPSFPVPVASPSAPATPATSTFGIGSVAGRALRGDLEEAKAEAVGAGLSSLYKQLDNMGFQSGQEFVVAVREADALGASLLLGDQDARKTLRRLKDALGEVLSNPKALDNLAPPPAALAAVTGGDGPGELNRENVESAMAVLKQRDNVRALSAYLRTNVPALYEALIAERDRYMANSLLGSDGRTIVAVVGLAHVDGIEAAILREAGTSKSVTKPSACAAL
mmetsp:Transcript_14974/g.38637  ORF Transcript_14974/g.38637 Transcript_14974/m.38637 type:complete len:369 (+) Transcript_14974:51-1157(+)